MVSLTNFRSVSEQSIAGEELGSVNSSQISFSQDSSSSSASASSNNNFITTTSSSSSNNHFTNEQLEQNIGILDELKRTTTSPLSLLNPLTSKYTLNTLNETSQFTNLNTSPNMKKKNMNMNMNMNSNYNNNNNNNYQFNSNSNSNNKNKNNAHFIGHTTKNDNEPFEIRWTNLTYQVEPSWFRTCLSGASFKSRSENETQGEGEGDFINNKNTNNGRGSRKTTILNGLSGSVRSGQVTAILGPSGAGKTSLLGCLLGKHKSGVSGCVQIMSNRTEPMSICTIPQKDFLLNQLTVRENLWFASRLKHPEKDFDHDTNIERVVDLLKLESCIDTKISKVSGGQYKRVSIAQELLSNPDILILDEPTSGLDSLTCYKTVMVLRDLARLSPNPMAIIVTIHQPQREVFELFNHVYILAIGGRCIYEGDPTDSIDTINKHGDGLTFDADQYNPASYLVEIASSEFGEKPIQALVEHHSFEFKRQAILRDNSIQQQNPGSPYGRLFNGTPNLKKRQSPMVARFKSTLSSLSPKLGRSSSGPKGNARSPTSYQYAYSNAAFEQHLNPTVQVTDYSRLDPSQLNTIDPVTGLSLVDENKAHHDNNDITGISIISANNNNNNNSISNSNNNNNNNSMIKSGQQMKRQQQVESSVIMAANGEPIEEGEFYLDDRLQTHKHNHRGHFLRHCQLLTKRSWLCLCKDPMLTTLRFTAHIIVPLLITIVYGSQIGRPNACPLYETEMDLIEYARNGPKKLLNLQDELRCSFENVGLFFLSIYAFTFSTMCLTSLSFPLNMHVLLKEVRNGWYSLPTYFIGKTLADFPLEFILPVVTLMITYPLTGQPSSYLEWRFLLGTGVFVITSLIAQTQGLIFGALFMNAMQAAVFVAPVSTTPLILLSGFLIRISQMPSYLQTLSAFSYFRYAIESLTIIRYGFGMCPCDPNLVTGKPVTASGVPDQLRSMTNYWLSTFSNGGALENDSNQNETSLASNDQPVDFFQDLTALLARANSFGTDIRTCDDLKPYPMIDFSLKDEQLYTWLVGLVATLFLSKVVNYLVVKYSVKLRL